MLGGLAAAGAGVPDEIVIGSLGGDVLEELWWVIWTVVGVLLGLLDE